MNWFNRLLRHSEQQAEAAKVVRWGVVSSKALDPRRTDASRIQQIVNGPYGPVNEPAIDQRDLEAVETYHDVVWRCIQLKSEDAAGVPMKLLSGPPRDPGDEILSHPVLDLFDNPAPDVTPKEFWQNVYADLDATGDSFNFCYKTGTAPQNFARLRPCETTPQPDPTGQRTIGWYDWLTNNAAGAFGRVGKQQMQVPWDRMFHVKQRHPMTSLRGLGTLMRLRVLIDMHRVMWEWNWNRYSEGIPTEYLIFFRGQFAPGEREQIEGQLRQKFSGPSGDNFMLLEADGEGNNLWDVKPFPRPTEQELAFNTSEKNIVYAIGRAFGVPPSKLMDFEQSTRIANADAMERTYWEDTIMAMHSLVLDCLNKRYLPLWYPTQQMHFVYDYSRVRALQQSALEMANIHAIYITNGVMSRNEARLAAGLEWVSGDPMMDAYLQNGRPLGTAPEAPGFGPGTGQEEEAAGRPPAIGEADDTEDVDETEDEEDEENAEGKRLQGGRHGRKVVAFRSKAWTLHEPLLDRQEEEAVFRKLVRVKIRAMVKRAGEQQLELAGIEGTFDMTDPRVLEFTEAMTVKLAEEVVRNTDELVRARIAEGYEEGASITEMREKIQDAFDVRREDWQLDRIARTETHHAQEGGSHLAAKQNGVEMKRWLTAQDSRVRGLDPKDAADHDALEQMGPIPIDAPFIDPRSGARMQFPGDRDGAVSGADTINCRCTWIADFSDLEDRKMAAPDRAWYSKAERRSAFELDFRRTLVRYYNGAEKRALAALRSNGEQLAAALGEA